MIMATIKEVQQEVREVRDFICKVRDCNANGHDWEFRGDIGKTPTCTLLYFKCRKCKVTKHGWLHGKEHNAFQDTLSDTLKGD